MQGGRYSDTLLCHTCESKTSAADTYGVAFLRRAREAFLASNGDEFWVENYDPFMMSKFALGVVWREVHGGQSFSLGPYDENIRQHVFCDQQLDWPIIILRENYSIARKVAVEFVDYPKRVKFAERNALAMTLLGYLFIIISDRRSVSEIPEEVRADRADPLKILVGEHSKFTDVPKNKPVLDRMLKGRKKNGRDA